MTKLPQRLSEPDGRRIPGAAHLPAVNFWKSCQGKIPPALLFHSDARSSRVCLKMQHRQSKNVKDMDGGPFGWNYETEGKDPGK